MSVQRVSVKDIIVDREARYVFGDFRGKKVGGFQIPVDFDEYHEVAHPKGYTIFFMDEPVDDESIQIIKNTKNFYFYDDVKPKPKPKPKAEPIVVEKVGVEPVLTERIDVVAVVEAESEVSEKPFQVQADAIVEGEVSVSGEAKIEIDPVKPVEPIKPSISYYYGFEGRDVFVNASKPVSIPDRLDGDGFRCSDENGHEFVFLSMPEDNGARNTLERSFKDNNQPYFKFCGSCQKDEVLVVDAVHGVACIPKAALCGLIKDEAQVVKPFVDFVSVASKPAPIVADMNTIYEENHIHIFADNVKPLLMFVKEIKGSKHDQKNKSFVFEQDGYHYHLHQMPLGGEAELHAMALIKRRDNFHLFRPDEALQGKKVCYEFSPQGVVEKEVLNLMDHIRRAVHPYIQPEELVTRWGNTSKTIHVVGNVLDACKIGYSCSHKHYINRKMTPDAGEIVKLGDLSLAFYRTNDELPEDVANDGAQVVDLTGTDFRDKKVTVAYDGLYTKGKRALVVW